MIQEHMVGILCKKYGPTAACIGPDGGFTPALNTVEEAVMACIESIRHTGLHPGEDMHIGLRCGADYFYDPDRGYKWEENGPYKSGEEMVDAYADLCLSHPCLQYIEDPFSSRDPAAAQHWRDLTERVCGHPDPDAEGHTVVIGANLFSSDPGAIEAGCGPVNGTTQTGAVPMCNGACIKVNQLGTVTEVLSSAALLTDAAGVSCVVGHRSEGETSDTVICDLAVGIGAQFLTIGGLCRSEHTMKFNRLIEIENQLRKEGRLDAHFIEGDEQH